MIFNILITICIAYLPFEMKYYMDLQCDIFGLKNEKIPWILLWIRKGVYVFFMLDKT